MADPLAQSLNRELLRQAGEHLGALAQHAKEAWELNHYRDKDWQRKFDRYARLDKLSRDLLEVAHG